MESQHTFLTSHAKLEQEIIEKVVIKDRLRQECEAIDVKHKAAIENHSKYKA